ncbi:thiamine pyrophosphate-binding protein [Patulibacter defluvii]|uniref:thiamine pyrophosphate-binding protein n=1 Tax=Patulibacter defluvii TaxID=3095358 RepID=UPI002A75E74F|nr:thiamine pyrophosphate-binding protein [Patulibacter sp. DM4]
MTTTRPAPAATIEEEPADSPIAVPEIERPEAPVATVGDAVAKLLHQLGVRAAFGVSGGGIGPQWAALERSPIDVLHVRHEAGGAFAALERSLTDGAPAVVFTTTGPGLTNAITGLVAARWEGARVILLSAATASPQRGRGALQETSSQRLGATGLLEAGAIFDYVAVVEDEDELPLVARRLAHGLARPQGFVAHVCLATALQAAPVAEGATWPSATVPERAAPGPDPMAIASLAARIRREPFVVWAGFGARGAAAEVRRLLDATGALAITTPRGKGIVDERDPRCAGVTGLGGHPQVRETLARTAPAFALVLGTRLSEGSSGWDPGLVPAGGFVQVDLDPDAIGIAYPDAPTTPVVGDVRLVLRALLDELEREPPPPRPRPLPVDPWPAPVPARRGAGAVRPPVLLTAVQRRLVDRGVPLLTDGGSALPWGIHHLRAAAPGRLRPSTAWASMGHGTTGVLGVAHARGGPAAALVGDGAMQMLNELNTAAQHDLAAIWVVLNDARYGMVEQGMRGQGLARDFDGSETSFPRVDVAGMAQALGVRGIRVTREDQLDDALTRALGEGGPVVVDVRIDPRVTVPMGSRIVTLRLQGAEA